MNDIEKMISNFISKDRTRPVLVEISGEVENPEEIRRILRGDPAEPAKPVDTPAPTAKQQAVTIPAVAYAELIRSQTTLDMLRKVWHKSTYGIDNTLAAVLGPRAIDEKEPPKEGGYAE